MNTPAPTAASDRPLVWVLDDSRMQSEICRAALSGSYDIEVFFDGAVMLEKLNASRAPDMLVLDWHMPNVSGVEVCNFIRQKHDAVHLPILVLTAVSNMSPPEAFEAGANDFVRKPFSDSELRARVGGLVRTKRIYAELAEAERRLRIEGEYRERFIAMLAHDLRQPINAFVLATRTLATLLPGSSAFAAPLAMLDRAARRMDRMINELLDFARTRPQAAMPVERRSTDLAALTRSVIEEMQMQIASPHRPLRLNVSGDCTGLWDSDRLCQVCSNLIGNAVEHSAALSTPIDVNIVRFPHHVELGVLNRGTPIPEASLPALFEPFRRGPATERTSGSAGLGLGLYIVHEIVKAHGGSISVRSDSEGTLFVVSLPVG